MGTSLAIYTQSTKKFMFTFSSFLWLEAWGGFYSQVFSEESRGHSVPSSAFLATLLSIGMGHSGLTCFGSLGRDWRQFWRHSFEFRVLHSRLILGKSPMHCEHSVFSATGQTPAPVSGEGIAGCVLICSSPASSLHSCWAPLLPFSSSSSPHLLPLCFVLPAQFDLGFFFPSWRCRGFRLSTRQHWLYQRRTGTHTDFALLRQALAV